jgi:hypothetical protein
VDSQCTHIELRPIIFTPTSTHITASAGRPPTRPAPELVGLPEARAAQRRVVTRVMTNYTATPMTKLLAGCRGEATNVSGGCRKPCKLPLWLPREGVFLLVPERKQNKDTSRSNQFHAKNTPPVGHGSRRSNTIALQHYIHSSHNGLEITIGLCELRCLVNHQGCLHRCQFPPRFRLQLQFCDKLHSQSTGWIDSNRAP